MILSTKGPPVSNSLFENMALTDKKADEETVIESVLKTAKKLEDLINCHFVTSSEQMKMKRLRTAAHFYLTIALLNRGLFFRDSKKLAVISGAGIAGLAASLELRSRGFKVVIAEKRESFSRCNVINLNPEIQAFLEKFNLLEKFEKFVAARIKSHTLIVIGKNKSASLASVSDVTDLQLDKPVSFKPETFHNLFRGDGIYSVPIKDLQVFLAENALDAGVHIFGNVTVDILSRMPSGEVSELQITTDQVLQPDLFFIAEGTHSTTAPQLGMKTETIENACSNESWVFGNLEYYGKKTFVVSVIDTSGKVLQIANVIFNAKSQVINVAVTSDREAGEECIQEKILKTVEQVFQQNVFPIEAMHGTLLRTTSQPIRITNRISLPFSKGNTYLIGNAAGDSSPLAGLGGTLALTLPLFAVNQLLDDYYEGRSEAMHENFHKNSMAYTTRWMQKSDEIKRFCITTFDKEHSLT